MTSLIWIVACSLLVASCAQGGGVPLVSTPSTIAVCEAIRGDGDMPVKYHASTTDAETIRNIRKANARFQAVCG